MPGVTHGIHLNFGPTRTSRLVIIPTVAAGIEAVERELAAAGLKGSARNGCSFSYQLHTLLECEYVASTDEGAEPMVNRLVADIVHLARLRADVASNDQLRPGIDKFATWFVGRFGQAA